jgi:hypothetical protein
MRELSPQGGAFTLQYSGKGTEVTIDRFIVKEKKNSKIGNKASVMSYILIT